MSFHNHDEFEIKRRFPGMTFQKFCLELNEVIEPQIKDNVRLNELYADFKGMKSGDTNIRNFAIFWFAENKEIAIKPKQSLE